MKTRKSVIYCLFISLMVFSFLFERRGYSQTDCNCDHTINVGSNVIVDANDLGVNPGDIICIEAGTYGENLQLMNFKGDPDNRITFINCGGVVNTPYMEFDNCQYFRLTGTGNEENAYGIFINGDIYDKEDGLRLYNFTTDFEIDHLEFANTEAAALHLVIRPKCDPMTQRGNFVIKNVDIHDTYVHDTGTEGFYIGHSEYYGVDVVCDGETIEEYPILMENIRVHNNRFVNTGWDAVQVGCAEKQPGALIYDNYIYNYGTKNNNDQGAGIVVGGGSSGRVYNNWIEKGATGGVHIFGLGDVYVFNNVIKDSGENGIFIGDKGVNPELGMHICNNNILNAAKSGIAVNDEVSTGNDFKNNIIINPGNYDEVSDKDNAFIYFLDRSWWEDYVDANYFSQDYSEIGFVDYEDNNYNLKAESPAVHAGVDLSDLGITFDYNYFPRKADPGFSLGAIAFGSEPSGSESVTNLDDPVINKVLSYNVYPNPASNKDKLIMDLKLKKRGGHVLVNVLDLEGRSKEVYNKYLSVGNYTVDLNQNLRSSGFLSSGLYFIVLRFEGINEVKKILIQN